MPRFMRGIHGRHSQAPRQVSVDGPDKPGHDGFVKMQDLAETIMVANDPKNLGMDFPKRGAVSRRLHHQSGNGRAGLHAFHVAGR